MAFNWSKNFSTSRRQKKNRFSNNSGRKDTIKMLKLFKNILTLSRSSLWNPSLFPTDFSSNYIKIPQFCPSVRLNEVGSSKKCFSYPCACSQRAEISDWNQGQKREIQRCFGIFFLGVLQGPHSVTSWHFAPSRVEWVGGERLGTRLQ